MSQCKTFLFLQGPISPFFVEIAKKLEAKGHKVLRINLNFGDHLSWRHKNAFSYRGSQKRWPEYIEKFLDEHQVTHVLLLGEQRYYHKVAIELAKERGIQVVATDFGYIRPDWITFERNGMSGNSEFPKERGEIFAQAEASPEFVQGKLYQDSFVQMAFWDIVYHISSILFRFFYPGYKSHQLHNPILIYLGTGLRLLRRKKNARNSAAQIAELDREGCPYFLFPLQMATDFSLRAYSDYPSLSAVIDEVLGSFSANADKQDKLVVKIHPLDPGLQNWKKKVFGVARKHGIEDRVVFLYAGDLVHLLRNAKGLVTVNSTVGIWALNELLPIKALGQAIYDINGLVSQDSLDDFWQTPTPPDAELKDAFFRAIAGTLQIRGVFYNRPGLDVAVAQAVHRLEYDQINAPVDLSSIK